MRKQIVAGNWKMNTSVAEGVALAKEVAAKLKANPAEATVVVAPPFTHLSEVKAALAGSVVLVSAQNCAAESKGAYTGEVSAKMLADMGVDAVILGHSERRSYYGDTDEVLVKKMQQVLANGLMPIFCCGELLEERKSGNHLQVVKSQLENVLWNLSAGDFAKVVIAYEPVWAIGTGEVATPEQAQEMHAYIRELLASKFGAEAADNCSLLYGGSAKPDNAAELFAKKDVDGGLIGGASLQAADFDAIIRSY